jgi:hypothetical protein
MNDEELVSLARKAGFKVENWLTNPPKPGLLYGSPEMLRKVVEAAVMAEKEDAARYRALFSIESFCCDPLWPVVDWFRGNDVSKAEVDAALDAAIRGNG